MKPRDTTASLTPLLLPTVVNSSLLSDNLVYKHRVFILDYKRNCQNFARAVTVLSDLKKSSY